MAVRNDNDNMPNLDGEDLRLLQQLDKQMKLQDDLADLRFYYQNKKSRDLTTELQNRPYRIMLLKSIDDLLYKYEFYKPNYNEKENIFYINVPIPTPMIMRLREDVAKFNIKDFQVIGKDEREGYKWTRQRKSGTWFNI